MYVQYLMLQWWIHNVLKIFQDYIQAKCQETVSCPCRGHFLDLSYCTRWIKLILRLYLSSWTENKPQIWNKPPLWIRANEVVSYVTWQAVWKEWGLTENLEKVQFFHFTTELLCLSTLLRARWIFLSSERFFGNRAKSSFVATAAVPPMMFGVVNSPAFAISRTLLSKISFFTWITSASWLWLPGLVITSFPLVTIVVLHRYLLRYLHLHVTVPHWFKRLVIYCCPLYANMSFPFVDFNKLKRYNKIG